MTTCSCVVTTHPTGDIWTNQATTPCADHRDGQPFKETRSECQH